MKKRGSGCVSFLLGSIFGGVISIIFSSYITRDLGDLPSIAIGQFFLALASAVSGGAVICLINDFRVLEAWSIWRIVRIVVLAFLVVPSIYYSYQFVDAISEVRLQLVNRYMFNEMRNFRQDLLKFVAKNGKEAINPDVLKKLRKDEPETFTLYNGLEIEHIDVGKDNKNNHILRMHHKKGNQEFALSRDIFEIYWRCKSEKDWKKVVNKEDIFCPPSTHN